MHRLQSISKRVLAALMFFTRLPLWRIAQVEREYYERVVPLWPLAGWLTGGMMAAVAWGAMKLGASVGVSVALAMTARTLLTGALHEDGFADFCDGFGGGTSRQRTLDIMKDSHIGTYGVLGLVLYALLVWNCLTSLLTAGLSPLFIIGVDAACKWMSSTIVCFLPYARSEAEAKNKLIYMRPTMTELMADIAMGLLPLLLAMLLTSVRGSVDLVQIGLAMIIPAVGCALLFYLMQRRLQGYTGDCCGATDIITETLFYISLCIVLS